MFLTFWEGIGLPTVVQCHLLFHGFKVFFMSVTGSLGVSLFDDVPISILGLENCGPSFSLGTFCSLAIEAKRYVEHRDDYIISTKGLVLLLSKLRKMFEVVLLEFFGFRWKALMG